MQIINTLSLPASLHISMGQDEVVCIRLAGGKYNLVR